MRVDVAAHEIVAHFQNAEIFGVEDRGLLSLPVAQNTGEGGERLTNRDRLSRRAELQEKQRADQDRTGETSAECVHALLRDRTALTRLMTPCTARSPAHANRKIRYPENV